MPKQKETKSAEEDSNPANLRGDSWLFNPPEKIYDFVKLDHETP